MAKLFDSHAHITDPAFDECRTELIEEIRASELELLMDVGSDLATSLRCVEAAREYDFCYAVVGCHPHEAKDFSDGQLEEIRRLCGDPRVRAIGEIGLDYHYDFSPRDVQQYWFRRQLDLALELKMPIVIHEREASEDCMRILKESGAFGAERLAAFPAKPSGLPDARVDIHCFSGSAETARQYVKLGASFGVDGPLTYKNNRKTVEVVETTDLEHLLIETDSPYLTPVPHRGETNKPVYVRLVAEKIAEIKGLSYEEVAEATFTNAKRFFDIE